MPPICKASCRAVRVDDNAHILLRFDGGPRVAMPLGEPGGARATRTGLRLRVYGEKGGLDWAQEDPNYLWFTPFGEAKRLLTRGGAGGQCLGQRGSVARPGGHPEGYLEGFANIYTGAAGAIRAADAGETPDVSLLPGLQAGLAGCASSPPRSGRRKMTRPG